MNGSGMPVTGMIPIVMPDVLEHLEHEHRQHPDADRACRAGRGPAGPFARSASTITPNSTSTSAAADEAELLPDGREDEVGLLLGHVAAVGLRPVEEALAGEAALADGGLGVVDLAGGLRRRSRLGVGLATEMLELLRTKLSSRSCWYRSSWPVPTSTPTVSSAIAVITRMCAGPGAGHEQHAHGDGDRSPTPCRGRAAAG